VLSDDNVQRYAKGLYPLGALLVLVPLVDLMLRVSPPQFGTLQWRFASAGLFFGNLGTVLLGVGIVGLAAAITGQRRLLRGLSFVALAMAVTLLALLVLFALDAIQIRRLANANFKRAVLLSSIGALFTGAMGTLTLFVLGRAGLNASRLTRVAERRPRTGVKPAAPIVVARQGTPDVATPPSAT
jgi:hypothetical protein